MTHDPHSDLREWIPVTLPSYGFYYGDKCPEGRVHITPWTTAQEERLVRAGEDAASDLIDAMTRDNIRLPGGLAYEELLSTDLTFLLYQLRIHSLVARYTVPYRCPFCRTDQSHTVDLADLKAQTLDDPIPEPFTCALPKSRVTVGLRLVRVDDEKARQRYETQMLEKAQDRGAPGLRFMWARRIVTIDGEDKPFQERMAFIAGLPMLDLRVMDMELSKHVTGLDTSIEAECRRCRRMDSWEVPLTPSFFRPLQADIEAALGVDGRATARDGLPGEAGLRVGGCHADVELAANPAVPDERGAG